MLNTQLQQARELPRPEREAMLARDPSVQRFWLQNRQLLQAAWQQWEQQHSANLAQLGADIIDSKLRTAVTDAWQQPTKESAVRELWSPVSAAVYQCQFFDPQGLIALREYLTQALNADIPLRPPYGIVLNRYGAMLDARSEGYLAAPGFQAFYNELINHYMRPIARMLFPEIMGFDSQSFGFSIRYQAGVDTSLRMHTDASAATLNINMNLPGETFKGSEIDFYDSTTGQLNRLSFKPGVAMLHRGHVAHAAQPITEGERSNLVLWLYGDRGRIGPGHAQGQKLSAAQRWQPVTAPADRFAPF